MAIYENPDYDPTAFMSGQTHSKTWLCRELEKVWDAPDPTIWIYGGWYATTNYILRARDNINPKLVLSFDLDPDATKAALILNEAYVSEGRFNALTRDVDDFKWDASFGRHPDIIINTSCEHMSMDWFNAIPKGTFIALQSNNMNHDDHTSDLISLEDFLSAYPITEMMFSGQLDFQYTDWGFSRYMLIGRK